MLKINFILLFGMIALSLRGSDSYLAVLESGVFNSLSITPLVYDKSGKWIDNANGGYASFFVIDFKSRRTVEMEIIDKIAAEFDAPIKENGVRPVGIQMHAKEMLLLQKDKDTMFAINFSTEDFEIYVLRQVSHSVYQFDHDKKHKPIRNDDLKAKLKSLVGLMLKVKE